MAPLLLASLTPPGADKLITETQHFRLQGEAVYDLNRARTANARRKGKIVGKHITEYLNFIMKMRNIYF